MNIEKRVIFDADGTIFDSMGGIFGAVCSVFESEGVKSPDLEEYVLNFRFPFVGYYHGHGVNIPEEEILRRYLRAYQEVNGEYNPPFFSDALSAIHWLHSIKHKANVVTANSTDNVLRVLSSVNLVHLIECVSASDKVEAIREHVNKSVLGPKTPYVGDIIADMEDARNAGAYPVAVLRNGMMKFANKFHQAGAKLCLSSLEYLSKAVTC
jgi:phosphoglycolate phosphatase-like HAD superfamily hydrolase